MADPHLQIKGGGGGIPTLGKGGGGGVKKLFQPFGPQFGLKINGQRPGPPGPPCRFPGSATEQSVWGTPPRPRQVCPGWRLGWCLLKINKKAIFIYIYIFHSASETVAAEA